MLFLWNDEQMHYVESFDSNLEIDRTDEYVLVRKLFLQFKKHVENINEQWIRDKFQVYGAIESIEIFNKEIEGHIWAYLTFTDDKDVSDYAYRAVTRSNLDEIDVILPADTWCQPSQFPHQELKDETVMEAIKQFKVATETGQSDIDKSNLLRKLISFSTKTNSESFKDALNNRILPTIKSFDFHLTDVKGTAISLREFRSILQCIGPFISDLRIHFRMDKYPKYVNRYFFKLCQYVGPNLNTLRLKWFPSSQEWLQQLKPVLCRIERLILASSNYDFEYDIDFQLYCPNLSILKMAMNLNGTLLSKKQPKLERISILHNQYMEERLVLEFMKNNPQILYMRIEANDSNNLLKQIPLHLPKLEKLGLYQGYPSLTADNLRHLIEMKQLKKLKLMYLDEEDFSGILNLLPQFRQLEELKLHLMYDGADTPDLDEIYSPDSNSIVTLAQELHQLECFHLRYCSIDSETLNNFIRAAKKLKVLSLYRCGLEITDSILEMVNIIRGSVNTSMLVLSADKIHPELNKEKTYNHVKMVTLYK